LLSQIGLIMDPKLLACRRRGLEHAPDMPLGDGSCIFEKEESKEESITPSIENLIKWVRTKHEATYPNVRDHIDCEQ
jgi:hypothetical protein